MSRRLAADAAAFPIRGRFSISRGTVTAVELVVVRLAEAGREGRGECRPYPRYNESPAGVLEQIEALRPALEGGMTRAELQTALAPGAARNALDCAFWDLEAKLAGRPAWQLAGLPRPQPLVTAYTLSLDRPEAMAAAAAANRHRPLLKLKLAGEGDLERVGAVRQAAPESRLILDANEGWSLADYRRLAPELGALGVALVEQPLPAAEDEALRGEARPLPLCADESVHDRASLPRLAGLYDLVNVKLDKTGGLTEALALREEARRLGLGLMVGCMVATSLAMAPAALLAQGADYVDLDGPLLLEQDRPEGLRYEGSTLYPPEADLLGMSSGSFVTHLECSWSGQHYRAGEPHNLSAAGKPLLVRYDLEALRRTLDRDAWGRGGEGFWRYAALLPVTQPQNRVSLGEVETPLIRLAANLWVKDEGRLPTGSFKARGLALAVAMAKELGLTHLAMPSNGNAGAALAAYAARAGLKATVFCPADTPPVNLAESALQGARVFRVNGLIDDCGKLVAAGCAAVGWFDVSTLKEPYRLEGKKTMGLELARQWGWRLPRTIFYPTGGGTGLIAMWKVFQELRGLGWLEGPLPRLVCVQASGCAPLVRAWEEGRESAPRWPDAATVAAGIRVPAAVGDFLVLRAVRESGGFALAVEDAELLAARDRVAREQGLLLCPEGAATYAAFEQARRSGLLAADEEVVLFNCASGHKYPLPAAGEPLDRHAPPDWARLGR